MPIAYQRTKDQPTQEYLKGRCGVDIAQSLPNDLCGFVDAAYQYARIKCPSHATTPFRLWSNYYMPMLNCDESMIRENHTQAMRIASLAPLFKYHGKTELEIAQWMVHDFFSNNSLCYTPSPETYNPKLFTNWKS